MAVTQGRNDGRKQRTPAKTMTSDMKATEDVVTNTRRTKEAPVMYIENRPQVDILDTGLEDATWHYLWANNNDVVSIAGYYNDGYRFVYLTDVQEQFDKDDLRKHLYTADVTGRVMYAENRLMRIPQEVYRKRIDAALNGFTFSAAEKAKQLLSSSIEQGKHDGTVDKSARISEDEDNGKTQTQIIDGGTE